MIFFIGSSYLFFLMIAKTVSVKQEKKLFLALFLTYFVIMAILGPNIRKDTKDNAAASQNQNENSKVSESRQKSGKVISNSINKTLNNTNISPETGNFNKFNSKKKIPKVSKKNSAYYDFESTFTSVLILIACMISCQALAWALATRINAQPVIQFDIEAAPEPEEIPMQPLAPANLNIELGSNQNEGPSAQPGLAQNLIVRRMRCPPEGNNLEPREDLDEMNYESLAVARPSVPAASSLNSHSERGNVSRGGDLNIARAAVEAAARSHRAAAEAAASSHRAAAEAAASSHTAATRATASSRREGSLQSRSSVANPLHRISEESSFQEEFSESSV
ncbi:hypothetical protein Avbf_12265 [Armadillidium vulgare]|nr:hypothetical protein Avbf_12265 [Armadillidium vulgare]